MFELSRGKVFDRLEYIHLQAEEEGLRWVIEQIGTWMVELDGEEKTVVKYLEDKLNK